MTSRQKFSENLRINALVENLLDELCPFLEEQANEISELTSIGKAIGTGKNIGVLLEMILSIAMKFTKADGGTLYLVDHKTQVLKFNVIHNKSLGIKKEGAQIDLPAVPLFIDDNNKTPNLSNVSSYVFHTGKIVNIKDVCKTRKFKFDGSKEFEKALHYKNKSMLVIPMTNHENNIIGILQLINSTDPFSGKTVAFSKDDQEKAAAAASQASVMLTQQTLIHELKGLFEAFIKAIAVSIDEKSKHTGGHIQRVTELSLIMAKKINEDKTLFKDITISNDQVNELRIAALMHDTGKIITPDHIIGKSSRLETIHDRIELIKVRWELFKTNRKLEAAQKKLALFDQSEKQKEITQIDNICKKQINTLEDEFKALSFINSTKDDLKDEHIDKLEKIHEKYHVISNEKIPCLTEDEFENLCIIKGTLTSSERDIINNHAELTKKILNKLPWPKKLSNIPSIAGAHHEKLDGSGYPLHLNKESLNIQARILAIADIFEALSAQDRPYKKPMTLSQTRTVLEQMGENGLLDKKIIKLFFKTRTHIEYAKNHLSESQIDF